MKRFTFLLLFLTSLAFAATPVTVTGTLQTGDSTGLKGNAFVRFRLRNFSGFVPRVVGTAIIVRTQFDVKPTDTSGNFTTPLYANSDIVPNTCGAGGTDACTWWTVEYWNDGKTTSSGNYCVPVGASYDLNSAVPCQVPPLPPGPVVSGTISGSGSAPHLALWNGTTTLASSTATDNGSVLGYGAMKTLSLSSGTSSLYAVSPAVPGSEPCSNLNPLTYIQDASTTNHAQTAIDPALTVTGFTNNGFLNFCRPPIFNSSGQTPGFTMNGVGFNVFGNFSASPDRHFLAQYEFDNALADSATYTTPNLGIMYGDFELNGTATFNTTFLSTLRFRMDDNKTGGGKPRVWSVYQGEAAKTATYDATSCTGGIDGFSNGPCYAVFYGEAGNEQSITESQAGVTYDVFAGGTKDLGAHGTNATGNVFHALVQGSTGNRFTNTRGFTSEDFGTDPNYYNFLSNGVNAAGTPSGYFAQVGPASFGSTTHPGAGIQLNISGGKINFDSISPAGISVTGVSSGAGSALTFISGATTDAAARSGNATLASGTNSSGLGSGDVFVQSGAAGATHQAGDVFINGGATSGSASGGNIHLSPGQGTTTAGMVQCNDVVAANSPGCSFVVYAPGGNSAAGFISGSGVPSGSCQVPLVHPGVGSLPVLYLRTDAPDSSHFEYVCIPPSTWVPVLSSAGLAAPGAIGGTTPAAGTFTTLTAALYKSSTNCAANGTAANPSVVSCSAAPAGAFSCATNASGTTCVVNTTAVTANSRIFVQETSAVGTELSVTCNTSPTVIPAIQVASISAGTSFTINMPTITTNPACFYYTIEN